jgi:hypothetical protein
MKTPIGRSPLNDTPAIGSPLLTQAAGILAREVARIPASFLQMPGGAPGSQSPALPNLELPVASLPGIDIDRLRRHAHDVIETLLTAFSPKIAGPDDRAAILRSTAPVSAGDNAAVTFRLANEEPTPSEVSLYSSNFVADNGYDIPASRVAFSPRVATIPPNGDAKFEIQVRVPQQAPPGIYSGLVQAFGSKYVKAVVSVEVK